MSLITSSGGPARTAGGRLRPTTLALGFKTDNLGNWVQDLSIKCGDTIPPVPALTVTCPDLPACHRTTHPGPGPGRASLRLSQAGHRGNRDRDTGT